LFKAQPSFFRARRAEEGENARENDTSHEVRPFPSL
jgi:hypothetical protein